MLCGTVNISHNIPTHSPHSSMNVGIFHGILTVPHNIVMNLNSVMTIESLSFLLPWFFLFDSWTCYKKEKNVVVVEDTFELY